MIQLELQFVGLTKRHCPVCGKEVVGRASKVYCSNECRHQAYYQANKKEALDYHKAHYRANKEKRKAKQKAYYKANKEKMLAYQKAWQQAHKEEMRAKKRDYHKAHKEERKAHRQANPEVGRAATHRRRARKLANGVEPTHEHRTTMVNPLTRQVCHYCGKDCTGDFHWDHFIPISKGGPEAPWNLVVSCPTCNLSKSDKLPESVFCDELGLVT